MTKTLDNEYVLELPELESKIDLNSIAERYKKGETKHMEGSGTYGWKIDPDDVSVNYIKNIFLDENITDIKYWYQIKMKHKYLKPHTDTHFRDTCIIFPIEPKNYQLLHFKTQNAISHVLSFRHPTLINTNLSHGTFDLGLERHAFQISFNISDYTWNKAKKIIKEKINE